MKELLAASSSVRLVGYLMTFIQPLTYS